GVDIFVGWHIGIAREVIPSRIQRIHSLLRAEMDDIREGHGAFAKLLVKRVGVEAQFKFDTRFATDGLRPCKGRFMDGSHGCETDGTGEKPAAIECEHAGPCLSMLPQYSSG